MLGTTAAPERCDTLYRPATECSTRPVPVLGNLRFRQLSTGSHTCAISMDGMTYCWGPNLNGQLGTGTTQPSVEPTPVVAPTGGSSSGTEAAREPPLPAPAETLRLYPINPPSIPGPEPSRIAWDAEIPDAFYGSSGIGTLRPDGRIVDDVPWIEVEFNAPADGEYTVVVIGTKAGAYNLSIGGYDVRHRSSWFTPKNVPITPGERHQYRFHFSAAAAGVRGLDGRRVAPPNR